MVYIFLFMSLSLYTLLLIINGSVHNTHYIKPLAKIILVYQKYKMFLEHYQDFHFQSFDSNIKLFLSYSPYSYCDKKVMIFKRIVFWIFFCDFSKSILNSTIKT